MRAITAILIGTLVATCATSCSTAEEIELIAGAAQKQVTEGNNRFAIELYQKLRTAEGNLFFSPYSISTALGMAYAGARGQTAKQMAEALGFPTSSQVLEQRDIAGEPMTQEEFAQVFGAIIKDLNARGSKEKYQLNIANALWGQKGYAVLPGYLKLIESEYGGKLEALDFKQAAEKARKTINAWVAEKTQDKIKELIGPGVLDPMTRLVLTNAIYFKGNWATQFKENRTRPAPFTLLDSQRIQTPMMNQKSEFAYAEASDLQILELPYVDDELSMVILLPKALDGIRQLERELTPEKLTAWLTTLRKQEVIVSIPKFKMTSKFGLAQVLASMGMADAFSRRAAFSGMTGRRELSISAVIHEAYVDVNEEGTEAAAATGVVMKLTSMGPDRTPVFRADHPFVFMIRDNSSGSILFLGRVMDPQPKE